MANQVRCVSNQTQTDHVDSFTDTPATELSFCSEAASTASTAMDVTSHVQSASPDAAVLTMDVSPLNMDRQHLIQAQKADPELQIIRNWVLTDCRPPFSNIKADSPDMRQYWREFPKLTLVDGLLCRKVRPPPGDHVLQTAVPSSLQKEVFQTLNGHSLSGHFSTQKILEGAQVRCFWHHMSRDINDWCLESEPVKHGDHRHCTNRPLCKI